MSKQSSVFSLGVLYLCFSKIDVVLAKQGEELGVQTTIVNCRKGSVLLILLLVVQEKTPGKMRC